MICNILNPWTMKQEKVEVVLQNYANNNNLAIQLICAEGEDAGIPYSTLTTNVCDLPEGLTAIDTNNNPTALDFITDNGLGEPTGHYVSSGYCSYPVYKINTELFQ